MRLKLNAHTPRILLAAGWFAVAAAAQAASGITVTAGQEMKVTPGMSAAEVERTLGRPAQNMLYGNEPGRTFTYQVIDREDTLFDVDFDANGRVVSTNERQHEPVGGAGQ
jgi:outer membrane protein assembly factor BamE (lipoprotein component of BamABCDE complex)